MAGNPNVLSKGKRVRYQQSARPTQLKEVVPYLNSHREWHAFWAIELAAKSVPGFPLLERPLEGISQWFHVNQLATIPIDGTGISQHLKLAWLRECGLEVIGLARQMLPRL